ncbi:hypothetical protein SNE25_20910 [Mucilaginibacter sabulilitoris]|uniref:Uncharacterized protein n=1 Tax=Mucilaginibacter sabulilitoris TaxID=1173583 RepID=A0ABZ0TF39_9SPHI|nr:hypothetical protein [Mucilaginibacter sabulilitoris]WPU91781.1 hypothetical protein SNE25_20910 [Mucilaginibacter sabulilitoris]
MKNTFVFVAALLVICSFSAGDRAAIPTGRQGRPRQPEQELITQVHALDSSLTVLKQSLK